MSIPVGIVWHDEGAWVHNARNQALWNVWRTDAWNPVFVSPVFTALEYGAFATLGVGVWQARVVPVLSGLAAILALVAGLHALAGRRAALIGGVLLAADYSFVMWNRAALMESTMTAWIVAAWAACALSERRPAWGAAAGACVVIAWFTKAAAAFFVAALAIEIVWSLSRGARRAAIFALLGGVATAAVFLAAFVVPYWTEYRFYNWEMSVTRKPEYSLAALADRASWLPIVQGVFSRMWLVLLAATAGLAAILTRWTTARPAERLLVLWILIAIAELVVHDSGNERRYVMFIPAFVALAALALDGRLPASAPAGWAPRLLALPVALLFGYLLAGSLLRPFFLDRIDEGDFSLLVRLSAGLAVIAAVALIAAWPRIAGGAVPWRPPAAAAPVLVALTLSADLAFYATWARDRAETNYAASVALGHQLEPGTLVQGKLANGLALENRIRPLFVGNGFGNYADRLSREDARYILTYDLPQIGYESSDGSGLIQGILNHYPGWRVVATYEVDETSHPDRAVLIDKFPETVRVDARD